MTTTETPTPAQPVTGLRVVTEWAVAYGCPSGDPNEAAGILEYDDEAEATEMLQWLPESVLARRTLIVGRWERGVDGESAASGGLVAIPATLAQTAAAGLDEAAGDRDERARYARNDELDNEAQHHTQRAGEYRQARDELLEAGR